MFPPQPEGRGIHTATLMTTTRLAGLMLIGPDGNNHSEVLLCGLTGNHSETLQCSLTHNHSELPPIGPSGSNHTEAAPPVAPAGADK